MASCCRSLSKPTLSLLKSTVNKNRPTFKSMPTSYLLSARSSLQISRLVPELGALQSLLPLHSAVSSAWLTSCLGVDSRRSRSLFQGRLAIRKSFLFQVLELSTYDKMSTKKLSYDDSGELFVPMLGQLRKVCLAKRHAKSLSEVAVERRQAVYNEHGSILHAW